jgi:murein DD-endopeptidase MepM/ murein hydrolase activator NlpD
MKPNVTCPDGGNFVANDRAQRAHGRSAPRQRLNRRGLGRGRIAALTLFLSASGVAAGAACMPAPAADPPPSRIDVRWEPDLPVQGRLFQVVVDADRPDALVEIRAELSGERLHFRPLENGRFVALAASPVDATGELILPVVARWEDGARDSVTMAVPIQEGEYRHERLTVAPQFGTQPDSALQERMRRESARAREVSRLSHSTPRLWDGQVIHPRPTRITSGFGHGREYNGEVTGRHMGTDFAGGVGAPIHAPARGIVALVDDFFLGGGVIYIDHGAGLVTAYLHLSEKLVEEGDMVEPGQLIGRVGATGRVTGPHLHWIVRYGNITVDPLSLFDVMERARAEAGAAP